MKESVAAGELGHATRISARFAICLRFGYGEDGALIDKANLDG